ARMLTVVVADNLKDDLKAKIVSVLKPFSINSVYLNINKTIGNRILGNTLEKLHGLDFIDVELCGFNYRVGPKTFLQVNYPVASKLYKDAVDFVGNDENAEALDLCCGVGTMTLMLSKHFKSVTGIEVVSSSIEAAKENAAINGIDNASFVLGDIREKIGELAKIQNIKGIICDPSRVGIGESACKTLSEISGPVKLSYIFCSLKALERDIRTLTDSGFKIEAVKGYDMFPYTMHVETAVFLSKCN
ncbi:MAG: class I SAM-dependent RNA methyltransferase, partial [Succinivibrio sp.]